MSVVGFDLGNESSVVAVARRRGIEVLQNEVGNRKTATMVGFQGKQRYIGDSAVGQYSNNIKNTVLNFKRLLGKKPDDIELKHEKPFMGFKTVNEGDKLFVQVNYDDKQERLLPEQITAAFFQKLKQIAERGLEGQKVVDCVLGVPPYWDETQRRALLDAANGAGLNVLRLMNETTAVALNYGILRPLPDKVANKVLFFDMGHSSTNVSLVSFVTGKLTVLATASDRNLGARDFDLLLVEHFAAYIKGKYKLDVLKDDKASFKLYKECNRVKHILSANNKVVFNVEYIMNDTDVKGQMERSEFEALAAGKLLDRILVPIQKVLEIAKVKKEELFAVEVVGGGVRIPCVQARLQEYLGRELSKTCDGDESVARGCALQCAMLSPSFRVKEFEVHDVSCFPIELAWGPAPSKATDPSALMDLEMEKSTSLFTPYNPIPSVKMISFADRTHPFQLVARYSDLKDMSPSTNPVIGRYYVSGMPGPKNQPIPKIKVRIKLNINGMVSVTSAQLIEDVKEEVKTPADASAQTGPSSTPNDPKAGEEQPKSDKQEMDEEDKEDMDTSAENDKKKDSESKKDDKKDNDAKKDDTKKDESKKDESTKTEEPVKKKKKVKRTDLKVVSFTTGFDQKQLQLVFEREAAMANQDRIIAETNEIRNKLESYILDMRSRVQQGGDLVDFTKEAERNKFLETLQQAEDWLYNDGSDVQKSEYVSKLTQLKVIGDPFESRKYESEHRLEFINSIKKLITQYSQWCTTTEEKYAHITEEERKKVAAECSSVDQWLASSLSKQESTPISDPPVITCDQIKQKRSSLEAFCNPIINKSKPKPPEPEKKEEPKKKEDAKNGKKDDAKKDETKNGETKKDETKKDETKKEEPKKDEPKKDEPKKDKEKENEPKKDEPKNEQGSKKNKQQKGKKEKMDTSK